MFSKFYDFTFFEKKVYNNNGHEQQNSLLKAMQEFGPNHVEKGYLLINDVTVYNVSFFFFFKFVFLFKDVLLNLNKLNDLNKDKIWICDRDTEQIEILNANEPPEFVPMCKK